MAILLNKSDVSKLLNMSEAINVLEKAFSELSNGSTFMPQRTHLISEDTNGLTLVMPAYLKTQRALGIKSVAVFKENPKKFQLPTIIGSLLLLDNKTGVPLAIMDATYLTAIRTGAAVGVAAKVLANRDSKIHVLFGTGGMSMAHIQAVQEVRNIEQLIIVVRKIDDNKREFLSKVKKTTKCEVELSSNVESSVRKADIISCITTSKVPLFKGSWLKKGVHISSSGSHTLDSREVDTETIQTSKSFCDSIEACKNEAGDFAIPVSSNEWDWSHIGGEIGEVINNKKEGRTSGDEKTFFKSVGLAVQDIAVAKFIYDKAMKTKVGLNFDFND